MSEYYLRRLADAMERVANALERAYPPNPLTGSLTNTVPRQPSHWPTYRDDPAQLPLPWHSTSEIAVQKHHAQSVAQHDQEPFHSESGYVRG